MLLNDVQRFEPEIERLITAPRTQNQWGALTSFTYNQSAANLESSTLRRLLNASDYVGAVEQFPRWNKARGKVLSGLVRFTGHGAYPCVSAAWTQQTIKPPEKSSGRPIIAISKVLS